MIETIKEKIKPVLEGLGLKLYDTENAKEFGENIFRILITKDGGIKLDDCVEATKQLSPILDVYEPMDGEYRLEVSSPGIERPLKCKEHYEASVGEEIKVTLKDKTKFNGKLLSVSAEGFTLEVKGEEEVYPFNAVSKARTFYQW